VEERTGRQMGSRALVADAAETWVCSYLSLALLAGVGLHKLFGWWWADPVGAWPCCRSYCSRAGNPGEARGQEDEDSQ